MAEYPAVRGKQRCPTHPGTLLRDEVLPALGLSVSHAARLLGVSRQSLHRMLAGKSAVSANMAVRLGKLVGNGPGLWIRMQAAYDMWHAERSVDTRGIPTLRKAS